MEDFPLFSAVVEVTNRCNLRCPHCASASGEARPDEMTLAELKGVIASLKELGCREFTMLGGEFLLRNDWYEVARAVREAGMELQLITNGLCVTPETRRQFLDLEPQTVCVSLDGATPESYRALRGVDGFDRCRRLLDDRFRRGDAFLHSPVRDRGDVCLLRACAGRSRRISTYLSWRIKAGRARFETESRELQPK